VDKWIINIDNLYRACGKIPAYERYRSILLTLVLYGIDINTVSTTCCVKAPMRFSTVNNRYKTKKNACLTTYPLIHSPYYY